MFRLQHRDHSKVNWATATAWPPTTAESIMVCYFKKLMGVVVFANAQGQVQFESSWTFSVLGLSDFTKVWSADLCKNCYSHQHNSDQYWFQHTKPDLQFFDFTFLYQTNSNCNTCFFFLTSILLNLSATFNFPHRLLRRSW